MRAPNQLVHTRTRVGAKYALLPLEGFPTSKLPGCPEADVKVLASPALGAGFVQMLVTLAPGSKLALGGQPAVETFYFVVSGHGHLQESSVPQRSLSAGNFGLLPPGVLADATATESLSLLLLYKKYELARSVEIFKSIHSHESQVVKQVWADNPHSLLQTLIPDDISFDLAMNIFSFDPGFGLPIVETHVMEHGLYFLQGKGLYYLEKDWMEVEAHDFIWMGPFCPQSFYATGPTPARYIYYKNVNRDILL